jgi:hypothetical protein
MVTKALAQIDGGKALTAGKPTVRGALALINQTVGPLAQALAVGSECQALMCAGSPIRFDLAECEVIDLAKCEGRRWL